MTLDPKALEVAVRVFADLTRNSPRTGYREDLAAAITAYLAALPPVDVADLADRVAAHWDEEGITAPVPVDVAELVERLRKLVILDEVGSDNPLGREAAQALTRLARERDALIRYAVLANLELHDASHERYADRIWAASRILRRAIDQHKDHPARHETSAELLAALPATKADTRAETSINETDDAI